MSTVVQTKEYNNITTRLVCLDHTFEKCVDCYCGHNICYNCYQTGKHMRYFMNFKEFKENSIKRCKRMTYQNMYLKY
jgi:hypothetical protein